ncbi:enhanced serine sensitivity protein SseB [Actinacidiphila sp. ITFR-21]|uniref:enhanced serine sensitivity protein SseB n=1 Tax=Actinacidiphila sp. ITFR-21 TaxID=3075199 RepID=UPI00288A0624|nr:enhanced serine sensitivity protein SseB [Streptomyces sp. ITFR-21]WNI18208.1 enhanced serine sensitivity protein SseB [Streptomyces sp. ITFR-21]
MENPAPYIWPANELEEVLAASLGDPSATPRLMEVLSRSRVWVPLPNGGHQGAPGFDLPTMELEGAPYVPVFSSEQQFRQAADGMSCTIAPVHEFARGLPPLVGIAVNPGGAVGVPVPPAAVAGLCRPEGGGPGAPRPGARVRLWQPAPHEEPVDFLAAAAAEFAVSPVVLSARRALASVEEKAPELFVGVELDRWQEADRAAAMDAVGRALGAVPLPWQVQLILLDVAQDPVSDWMLEQVGPFFVRD